MFYLLPRTREDEGSPENDQSNIDWYQLRQAELNSDTDQALQSDLQLRLLEDEQQRLQGAPTAVVEQTTFPVLLLLPVIALLSGVLYYQLGAATDVLITRQLESVTADSSPEEMEALMLAIEARAQQRPDNVHYGALLGRFYMGQQNYSKAAEVYSTLVTDAPDDSVALAYAAQASYLANGRVLNDKARMLAEQALAIDPRQRTALGLLGMASYELQQYRAAIEYWQRLVAMEEPGSETAVMIGSVIAQARVKLGEAPTAMESQQTADAGAAVSASGVSVTVELPEGVALDPSDTVFVLARNAESTSRMPIAVQRFEAGELPLTLRLDDSNSMAGQKLSSFESVMVLVQISPDGRPGEAGASWLGQAGPLNPSSDIKPLLIELSHGPAYQAD